MNRDVHRDGLTGLCGAALHVQFEALRFAGDESRPGLHEHVAQLEAALAINIILKVALRELEGVGNDHSSSPSCMLTCLPFQ